MPGAGTLPPHGEWVTLAPAALVLSAIKPADDGDGLIVRFYNSSEQPQTARVTFGFPVATMQPVNLLEEPEGAALGVSEDGRVTLDVPPKRIVTWRASDPLITTTKTGSRSHPYSHPLFPTPSPPFAIRSGRTQ